MNHQFFAVVTTIQTPTPSLRRLAAQMLRADGRLLVVGDAKGPAPFELEATTFLSLTDQVRLQHTLATALPTGHYARKNVGYLEAIAAKATCIYETDDDNAPGPAWKPRAKDTTALTVADRGWVNVYRAFTAERIWPRGFPLDAVMASCASAPVFADGARAVTAPVQQGLSNNSPDVDAVWRLVLDRPFEFADGPSLYLPPGAWSPFNSQSTWWWPEAYPLLYLPSHCSFRMTDIWRSFIAQRCLWELGHGVVFHAAEVIQERNPHNLMRDFADELQGYQRNRELVEILEAVPLSVGAGDVRKNLRTCYDALCARGFFPQEELALVDAWLADLAGIA